MLSTRDTYDALLAALRDLGLFKDVQRLSLQKAQNAEFFKTLPALRTPGALLIWKDRDDSVKGSGRDRLTRWSLVAVTKDLKGDGALDNLDLLDTIADDFLDQQLLDNELTVLGSHKVAVAVAHESLSVIEIAFETREASTR